MKRIIAGLAVLAMTGIASAITVTNYVPDGDFEQPNGDVGPWANQFGDPTSFLPTGGNPNGCAQVADFGSFGGFAYVNPTLTVTTTQPTLASLGLTANTTYTFVMDMQIVAGAGIGGLKIESWSDTGILGDSGNMYPLSGTTGWATYSFTYKIRPGATHLNIVPLWGPSSTVNFDNIGVVVLVTTPLSVSITSPTNSQVVYSNFTVSASSIVSPGTVTNVAFYVDNAFGGNATNAPFGYVATGISSGAHTLKAVAKDSNGNSATSSVVNMTVTSDPIPPFAAYEPFDYSSLSSGTPSTGSGFTGNWSCGAAGTIVSGLTYPNLAVAFNALQSSGSYQLETLAGTPSGIGTVWVSFILNQSGNNGANRSGFALEDSAGNGVMFAYHEFGPAVGSPALTTIGGYTAVGSTLSPYSGTTQTYAANNFYVLQLTYAGGSLSNVKVYSNPTAGPGQTTPPSPDFSVSSGLSGIGALNVLGVVDPTGIPLTVDEVRVGTSYAAVVGAALNPTVPTSLALSIATSEQVSWSAQATNYYQPQSSTDNVNWNNLGGILFGTATTSVFDLAPTTPVFYQVQEILPVATETIQNGGFETDIGSGSAADWSSFGSQPTIWINTDAHTGTSCMELFVTNSGTATAGTCDLQQNNIANNGPGITGGNIYNFSFWSKSLGKLAGGGYVQQYKVAWLNSLGGVLAGSVGFAPFTSGNGTWAQTTTGSLVAPTNAVNVLIEIFCATGGITNDFGGVLVDDMSLSGTTPTGAINILSPTVRSGAIFTATVLTTNGMALPDASGYVTFQTNGVVQSTGTVAAGAATSAASVVPANYTVTAIYGGDGTYFGSSTNQLVGTAPSAPAITGIAPITGLTSGGTVVTITGSNFLAGVTVQFGANAGTGVSLTGSTSLTVSTPAGAAGPVNVIVTNPGGLAATNVSGFTYVLPPPAITTIAPNTGRTNGGTVVTITGANFVAGVTVKFGANAGTGVTLTGSTSLTVSTPAGAAGAVNVVVTNPGGLAATNVSGFTYVLPPPGAKIVPGSVVKSGSNLNMVWSGGTNATCPVLTTTSLNSPVTWTPVATNTVGANGLSTNSLPINSGESKRFYILSIPYN